MPQNNNQKSNSLFSKVVFNPNNQQNGLISLKKFKKGDVICHFGSSEILQYPNRYTVQISDDKHIILSPLYLEYINHSCDPNCFFDTSQFVLKALKDIQAGEEFNFFYPSTEWEMDEAFECQCHSKKCLGAIRGAKYLDEKYLQAYQFTDYILNKIRRSTPHVFQI